MQADAAVFAVVAAYLPMTHSRQWPVWELAVVPTYLPALQSMHEAEPALSWYVP
jgi:hypothetical protein